MVTNFRGRRKPPLRLSLENRPGAGHFSATPSYIRPLVVGLKNSAYGIFNRLQFV